MVMPQLANSMKEMRGNEGKLLASVQIPNKDNVSKVTLRSGTSYKEPKMKVSLEKPSEVKDASGELIRRSGQGEEVKKGNSGEVSKGHDGDLKETKPFPYRFAKKKKKEDPMDYMPIFGKLEVTLPFITRKAKEGEKIVIEENVSVVIQEKPPQSELTRYVYLTDQHWKCEG